MLDLVLARKISILGINDIIMARSITVAPECIPEIKRVLKRQNDFSSQEALAKALGLSRTTTTRFFTGKPVDSGNFIEICKKLGLDWQTVANLKIVQSKSIKINHFLSMTPPPFGDRGRITDPKRFFNREELLRQLFEELGQGSSISLVGEAQVGKSSILSMICRLGPERLQLPSDRFIDLDMQWIGSEEVFFEALCCELGLDEPCRGYRLLRALAGKRYILCLDEIEKMVNREAFSSDIRTELRGLSDGADRPLTLAIASRLSLDELFRDSPLQTSPLSGICRQLDVLPFSEQDTHQFLTERLEGTGVSFTEQQIADLFQETQGHPAYLQSAAAKLYRRLTQQS